MAAADILKKPEECVMLLVDFQAGLGFGVESIPRQVVINNAVALARTLFPPIGSASLSPDFSQKLAFRFRHFRHSKMDLRSPLLPTRVAG